MRHPKSARRLSLQWQANLNVGSSKILHQFPHIISNIGLTQKTENPKTAVMLEG
jgi:hypothetical protein